MVHKKFRIYLWFADRDTQSYRSHRVQNLWSTGESPRYSDHDRKMNDTFSHQAQTETPTVSTNPNTVKQDPKSLSLDGLPLVMGLCGSQIKSNVTSEGTRMMEEKRNVTKTDVRQLRE